MMFGRQARRYRALVAQYGWRRCVFRAWHDMRRRRGWLHASYPAWDWTDRPLSSWLRPGLPADPDALAGMIAARSASFLVAGDRRPTPEPAQARDAIERAEGLLAGRFPYFQRLSGSLSFPDPTWFRNPFTGATTDASGHWLDRADFDPALGDIKVIWEPSRFSWVYDLVRAHAATGVAAYPEAFWRLVASWRDANPPQRGPNWQCGQEVAIRVIALSFGLQAFWGLAATTPRRVADLVVLLAASAERIATNIDYARAQMGNHATSEAAALVTVARSMPELAQADRWLELGKRVLADESRRFHWPDGSYVQHSMNYHRLMLDAYLWAGALGVRAGDALPQEQLERLDRSWRFLYEMQDPDTGRVPNYGPNDGAQLLPLHGCGYLDFRPDIDACSMLTRGRSLFGQGPWSEKRAWLYSDPGPPAAPPVAPRRGQWFASGGYDTFRGRDTWAMVRCHRYRNRPNQADMLHVDLWWRGVNLLRDSGTFTYHDPASRWERYFVSTAAHNTVRLGGVDQMIKGARFQWHSLIDARRHGRRATGDVEVWSGEHRGYRRLPSRAIHGRAIVRCGDACWIVVDDLRGRGREAIELFWHLHDAPLQIADAGWRLATRPGAVSFRIAASAAFSLTAYRGEDADRRAGWHSLYYGERTPAPTIVAETTAPLPVRIVTVIAFSESLHVEQDSRLTYLRWRCAGMDGEMLLEQPGTGGCPLVSVGFGADRWDRDSVTAAVPSPAQPPERGRGR